MKIKKGYVRNLKRGRRKPPAGMSHGVGMSVAEVIPPSPPVPPPPSDGEETAAQRLLRIRDAKFEVLVEPDLVGEARARLHRVFDDVEPIYLDWQAKQKKAFANRIADCEKVADIEWSLDDRVQMLRNRISRNVETLHSLLGRNEVPTYHLEVDRIGDALVKHGEEARLMQRAEGLRRRHIDVEGMLLETEGLVEDLLKFPEHIRAHPTQRIRREAIEPPPLQRSCITQ